VSSGIGPLVKKLPTPYDTRIVISACTVSPHWTVILWQMNAAHDLTASSFYVRCVSSISHACYIPFLSNGTWCSSLALFCTATAAPDLQSPDVWKVACHFPACAASYT